MQSGKLYISKGKIINYFFRLCILSHFTQAIYAGTGPKQDPEIQGQIEVSPIVKPALAFITVV